MDVIIGSESERASGAVRWLAYAAALMTLIGTLAFGWSTFSISRPESGYLTLWDGWAYFAASGAGVALAAWRTWIDPQRRAMWGAIALALLCWMLGGIVYTYHDINLAELPVPAWSDFWYYLGYLLLYAGLMVEGRRAGALRSSWLDGAVVGLAVSAVVGTFVLQPIVAQTGVDIETLAWSVSYPLLALLLLVVLVTAFGPYGRRLGSQRALIAAGIVAYAATDIAYAYTTATSVYVPGTVLDAGWLVGASMIALASLLPGGSSVAIPRRLGAVKLPVTFGFLALGVVATDIVIDVPRVAMGLGTLAIALAMVRTVLTAREVRELHDSHRQARTDELTRLPNRRALLERLAAAETDAEEIALVLIDLDGFKEINDSLGHDVGDELLRLVADRLGECFPAGTIIARLGGDEFGVILAGGASSAARVAGAAMLALDRPFRVDDVAVRIGGSAGVAAMPEHALTRRELLKCADVAMYTAKRTGHDSVVYEAASDPNGRERLQLIEELRTSIDVRSLELHFQPVWDVRTRELAGCEALVRWRHPTMGLLAPAAFVPLAEQTGLIRRLTKAVLTQAVEQCAAWARSHNGLRVSVNISATDLVDDSLPDLVAELLRSHGLRGDALTLEITETSIVLDSERAQRAIHSLRGIGVRVSVDDFGVGYSSMSQLLALSIDEVKIDRSFVSGVISDPKAHAIVAATVQLGRALGVVLVAEGIEDDATLTAMRDLGVDRAQGFLLGRPVPAAQFAHEHLQRVALAGAAT